MCGYNYTTSLRNKRKNCMLLYEIKHFWVGQKNLYLHSAIRKKKNNNDGAKTSLEFNHIVKG